MPDTAPPEGSKAFRQHGRSIHPHRRPCNALSPCVHKSRGGTSGPCARHSTVRLFHLVFAKNALWRIQGKFH
ncbi:hypothetical protein DESPIGER_1456 [Desulfovibrio piger]|uniref:Uncharacterized protein n=1 Tax=Desulfovibrio piger TaxID=901 RepID=A0A1K1LF20_9BACT|nr:hypothetical protein DESPIGER_1456 [Desulfovibrio piger]